jgi:hypothetical protein
MSNIFDVNVPRGRRWNNALALVRAQGGRKLCVLYDGKHRGEVKQVRGVAQELNFSTMYLLDVDSLSVNNDLLGSMSVIAELQPDLMVIMASDSTTVLLLLSLISYGIVPNALVTDVEPGALAMTFSGFLMHGLLSPMVWQPPVNGKRVTDVFGSFEDFNATYMSERFGVDEFDYLMPELDASSQWRNTLLQGFAAVPPMGALQIATAGELYVSALVRVVESRTLVGGTDLQSAESLVAGISAMLRSSQTSSRMGRGVNTLLGLAEFDAHGERLNRIPCAEAGTQQWLPDTRFGNMSNYIDNELFVVSGAPDLAEPGSSKVSAVFARFVAEFEYPLQRTGLGWVEKQRTLYPCEVGCYFTELSCRECPPGKYRGSSDYTCRWCEPGYYNNGTGSSACMKCPVGSDCSRNIVPEADPGWYRFKLDVSMPVLGGASGCPAPKDFLHISVTIQCPSVDVCLGSNRCTRGNVGFLCAQCVEGYSWQTRQPGRRECNSCAAFSHSIWGLLCLLLLFGILVYMLQRLARRACSNPSAGGAAALRTLVQYLQTLACILEAGGCDTESHLSIILNILYRPLDMIAWDCFMPSLPARLDPAAFGRNGHVLDKVLCHLFALPVGVILILTFFVLRSLLPSFCNSRSVTLWCRGFFNAFGIAVVPPPLPAPIVEDVVSESSSEGGEGNKVEATLPNHEMWYELTQKLSQQAPQDDDHHTVVNVADVAPTIPKLPASPSRVSAFVSNASYVSSAAFYPPPAPRDFKRRSGPGSRFIALHAGFHLHRLASNLVRCVLAFVLIAFAPVLRGIAQGFSCVAFAPMDAPASLRESPHWDRFTWDLDVECSDPRFAVVSLFTWHAFLVVGLFTPFSVLALLVRSRRSHSVPQVRRSVCVLYVGFKPRWYFWEFFCLARLFIVVGCTVCFRDVATRMSAIMLSLCCFIVLHVLAGPYLALDRNFVSRLDLLGMAGTLLVTIASLIFHMADGAASYDAVASYLPSHPKVNTQEFFRAMFVTSCVVFNLCVGLYGLLGLVFRELVMTATVAKSCGCVLGKKKLKPCCGARSAFGHSATCGWCVPEAVFVWTSMPSQ